MADSAGARGTILVVDDASTERKVLTRYVGELGYQAITAENGRIALEIMLSQPIDLVLLDIIMPELDGMEVLARLQQDPDLRRIPVIMLSGSDLSRAAECIEAGAEDLIIKPFVPSLLKARIGNCLAKKRLHDMQLAQLKTLHRLQEELEASNRSLKQANLTLEELAHDDATTGLGNRRAGALSLEQLWAQHQRTERPLSCVLIDVDQFRDALERQGTAWAETFLRQLADLLKSNIRGGDVLTRFGPDTFLLVCPDTELDGACELAERLRQQCEQHLAATLSLGVAQQGLGNDQVDQLLQGAEQALAQAKAEGRNRVRGLREGRLAPPPTERTIVEVDPLTHKPRLEALDDTGLLDTPIDERLQRVIELVAALLRAPVALVSLVTDDRQFFAVSHGLGPPWGEARQTPLSHSFCQHVVRTAGPLVVGDARNDPRVCDNLAIVDLKVEAYLGVPLHSQDGGVLGSLCVIDSQPRQWRPEEQKLLETLALAVESDLKLRVQQSRHQRVSEAYREARALPAEQVDPLQWLASASHEMRSPLNGILGLCELLQGTPLTEEQREFLGLLRSSADAMLDSVNDILDLARFRSGELKLQPKPTCVRDFLAEVLKPLALRASQEGLRLYLMVDRQVPEGLLLDPVRLRQVLINLVTNALKFTPQGSVTVRLQQRDDHLEFAVEDTGIGIPAERCRQIFEPFAQVESELSNKHRGTGLGLAIVRQIVQAMGGEIACHSQIGLGSTFFWQMPLRCSDTPKLQAFPLNELRLAVDDERLKDCLRELLEAGECQPVSRCDFALVEVGDESTLPQRLQATGGRRAVICPPGWRPRSLDSLPRGVQRLPWPFGPGELRLWMQGACASLIDSRETAPAQPRRLLVVDDSRVNLKLVSAMLRRLGHEVRACESASQALLALQEEVFDAALVDVEMPGMDGCELAQHLRGQGLTLPLVAVTGHIDLQSRNRCKEAGMNHYLTKPFTLEDLNAALQRCF